MKAYFFLCQLRLDSRPRLALRSIAEQVHDDCAFGDCLVNVEQVGSRDPAVVLSFLP